MRIKKAVYLNEEYDVLNPVPRYCMYYVGS